MSRETSLLPVTRREIVSWALYDFANSAFTTLIVTFIFSAYFAQSIAPDPIEGAIWWTRAVQTSAIVVAVVMPVLGAIADSGGLNLRSGQATLLERPALGRGFLVRPRPNLYSIRVAYAGRKSGAG